MFIIASLIGILVGVVFGRCSFDEGSPTINDEREKDVVSTDTGSHKDLSRASSLAQGLKDFTGELIGTKPFGMNITRDGLYQYCVLFEVKHYGVVWECWTDGAHTLIGVDAPPLCASCRTPLNDVDTKKWSCPNCNASYDKPPIGANPADIVAKIVSGKIRRNELNIEDAAYVGTDIQCEF